MTSKIVDNCFQTQHCAKINENSTATVKNHASLEAYKKESIVATNEINAYLRQ